MVFQYAVVKKAWLDIHYHARSLKKSIKNQIAEENKKKLYDAAVKSGLSVSKCIEIISSYEQQDTKTEE